MNNQQFDEEEQRFQFGENWKDFLSHIDESRVVESDKSLKDFRAVMISFDSGAAATCFNRTKKALSRILIVARFAKKAKAEKSEEQLMEGAPANAIILKPGSTPA